MGRHNIVSGEDIFFLIFIIASYPLQSRDLAISAFHSLGSLVLFITLAFVSCVIPKRLVFRGSSMQFSFQRVKYDHCMTSNNMRYMNAY